MQGTETTPLIRVESVQIGNNHVALDLYIRLLAFECCNISLVIAINAVLAI